jgi:hypothetical protein
MKPDLIKRSNASLSINYFKTKTFSPSSLKYIEYEPITSSRIFPLVNLLNLDRGIPIRVRMPNTINS